MSRGRLAFGAGLLGPILIGVGWPNPFAVVVGGLLVILAIILWAESHGGPQITQTVATKIIGNRSTTTTNSHNKTTMGGFHVSTPHWFSMFNKTTVIQTGDTDTPTWQEKRNGPRGRRVGDQPPVNPNDRIAYEGVKDDDVQLFDSSDGTFLYSLIQVWFRNVDQSPITELSAEIVVTDDHEEYWKRSYGRWAIGTLPQNVGGWEKTKIKVDLAPGEKGKLIAFQKHPQAMPESCRFFVDGHDDGNPDRDIWGRDRAVSVRLTAKGGIDRTFQFRLVNETDTFALLVR
jgi:hypothetical protein